MMKIKSQKNRGYTLLFAVLVASVVLSIGISILTISKKEFLLSSSARESTSAFYAADSGLECAIFNADNFSTTTGSGSVKCMGQTLGVGSGIEYLYAEKVGTFTFDVKMQKSNACAVVELKLWIQEDDPVLGDVPRTTIESRGYNLGWKTATSKCELPSPKRVERALRYTF